MASVHIETSDVVRDMRMEWLYCIANHLCPTCRKTKSAESVFCSQECSLKHAAREEVQSPNARRCPTCHTRMEATGGSVYCSAECYEQAEAKSDSAALAAGEALAEAWWKQHSKAQKTTADWAVHYMNGRAAAQKETLARIEALESRIAALEMLAGRPVTQRLERAPMGIPDARCDRCRRSLKGLSSYHVDRGVIGTPVMVDLCEQCYEQSGGSGADVPPAKTSSEETWLKVGEVRLPPPRSP